jgi:hypothetical protein
MERKNKLAVNIREAAAMLSVSPRTIQNYISAKVLFPVRKIGRRTVIPIRTLENFPRCDHASPMVTNIAAHSVNHDGDEA